MIYVRNLCFSFYKKKNLAQVEFDDWTWDGVQFLPISYGGAKAFFGVKLNIKKLFSSYLHPMAEPKIFLGVKLNIKELFRAI